MQMHLLCLILWAINGLVGFLNRAYMVFVTNWLFYSCWSMVFLCLLGGNLTPYSSVHIVQFSIAFCSIHGSRSLVNFLIIQIHAIKLFLLFGKIRLMKWVAPTFFSIMREENCLKTINYQHNRAFLCVFLRISMLIKI